METYYILSGEGNRGAWSKHELKRVESARTIQNDETSNGDRFARLFLLVSEDQDGPHVPHLVDLDNGDVRDVPSDIS